MDELTLDRLALRELIDNWVIWRDAGDWERFASVWHDDGRMMATWFQGPADDFIRVSREGFDRGVSILHFLGGTSIDLAGERAIAQTKMTISQRAEVDGVACDVVCTGASTTSSSGAAAVGDWCSANRSMRRTGSTRSTRPPRCSSTASGSSASPPATATSPT